MCINYLLSYIRASLVCLGSLGVSHDVSHVEEVLYFLPGEEYCLTEPVQAPALLFLHPVNNSIHLHK